MGTRVTAVESPAGGRRGSRRAIDEESTPDPLAGERVAAPANETAVRTAPFTRNSRPRARPRFEDAAWEIVLNKLVVVLCIAGAAVSLALTPFIGLDLSIPLVCTSFAGAAYFGLSWITLPSASRGRLRFMRLLNSTVEASLATIALVVITIVEGPLWAATSPVVAVYTLPIVLSGARLNPRLTLYVTAVIIAEYLAMYHVVMQPALTPEQLAVMPPLDAWGAWERAFWFALAGLVAAAASRAARSFVIFGARQEREKLRIEKELGRYVSNDVAGAILRGETSLGSAERRVVTVLFCDLRDFTSICAEHPPEEVVQLLNEFYGRACRIIEEHGGTVNKFLGDGMLALFGAPHEHPNHARAAAEAAHDILGASDQLRAKGGIWRRLDVGIGLDSGDVVVGGIGAQNRLEYTAIGATVNRAARLQSLSRKARRRIILSRDTVRALGDRANVVSLGEVSLKGFSSPEPVYAFRYTS